MTRWRWPSRTEQAEDFHYLSNFVDARTAAAIAAMPCVITDPEATAPFSLRADAWLHRMQRDWRKVA